MPVGPTIYLKVDINGTAESRVVAFDFLNLIAAGDELSGTPTVEQSSETTSAPSLTIGTAQISGTQALARVTGTGLTVGTFYDLSCTATTLNGDTLVASCGMQIIPSK